MASYETLRDRIARLSGTARLIALLGAVLTPVLFVLLLAAGRHADLLPLPAGIVPDLSGAGLGSHIAVAALAALRPLVFLVALWLLQDLFRRYRRGAVFEAASTRRLWQLGWVLVAIDAAAMLQRLAAGPLLSHLGLTEPFLSVGLGASFAIIGLFVIVIARIMELGCALQEFEETTI